METKAIVSIKKQIAELNSLLTGKFANDVVNQKIEIINKILTTEENRIKTIKNKKPIKLIIGVLKSYLIGNIDEIPDAFYKLVEYLIELDI